MTENNEREITRKICKPEFCFLGKTLHLMELYKCVKFYYNISKGFGVVVWTPFITENNKTEITTKNMEVRVMFLVHDTLSNEAKQMCDILSK